VAPFTLHASMMYHYRKGAYFPKGGAGSVAQAIIPVIESAGGQVAVKSPVEQILIEGNRAVGVRLAGGHEVRSKLIISDASAYTTFTRLVPREVSERHGYLEKVSRTTSSPSHISAMVGWDESISLPRHIVWQMPRCEPAIPHHDVANGDRFYKEQMRFDCMPAYLMSPSSRDPLHATRYPNKTTMMLLVEANPKWLEQATAEPEFRKELESRFIEEALKLMRRRFSQLEGKTPLLAHVQFPMGCNPSAREGGSYGIATTSDRFLRDTHWLRPKTTIENLYLCGQDTFMPGIAGVLIGSRFVYAAITGDWLYLISQEASQYRPRLPAARDEQVGRAPKPR
jgi:all-trans-retinol 13,14-reductase